MKKVLIAITSLHGGGAERVVSVWTRQLFEKGYDVSVLVLSRQENEYPICEGVNVYTVAQNPEQYLKLSFFERFKKMRSFVKNINPDVLINFLPTMQIWMLAVCFGLGIKRIETVRNNPDREASGLKQKIWKFCLFSSKKVILQTKEQGEFFGKVIQNKCVVIPNPICKQYCENCKQFYNEKNTEFIAVGRLASQKNYPLMINAFKLSVEKCSDIKLSIFGSNSSSKLQELINELNMQNNIFLMGRSENVSQELLKRDAFIMSSDYEGMPNALAEAMATGLVCISTDCRTGPKDLIDDGINGFLVQTGNTEEMANAILKVIEMPKEESERIGKSAREKILHFCSEENSFNRLVELIEDNN